MVILTINITNILLFSYFLYIFATVKKNVKFQT